MPGLAKFKSCILLGLPPRIKSQGRVTVKKFGTEVQPVPRVCSGTLLNPISDGKYVQNKGGQGRKQTISQLYINL